MWTANRATSLSRHVSIIRCFISINCQRCRATLDLARSPSYYEQIIDKLTLTNLRLGCIVRKQFLHAISDAENEVIFADKANDVHCNNRRQPVPPLFSSRLTTRFNLENFDETREDRGEKCDDIAFVERTTFFGKKRAGDLPEDPRDSWPETQKETNAGNSEVFRVNVEEE
ncbi:hypothetical protein PUN28_013704 [Cardiocondyla obscurior]|uniref:Uncharacterized protein n=1 Tax=Cardiocondyla obscurior TaxID=286306 RepID=A0AAW2F8H6_9HYME